MMKARKQFPEIHAKLKCIAVFHQSCKLSVNVYLCVPNKSMRGKVISKQVMVVVGIFAAVIILLSPALQKEARSFLSEIKSKQTKPTSEKETALITVQTDAVTSTQSCETVDANPSVIREIILEEGNQPKQYSLDKTILASFFKTLFRMFISPQAP